MAQAIQYDAVIIGGGFYGACLALHLERSRQWRVVILERAPALLQRASYVNQARVHNGYHYPRSLLTGLRSRINFPRFVKDYRSCIDDEFEKYYAIGRVHSNVTAAQFRTFCERIEAPIERAPKEIRSYFDGDLIEDVFSVQEYAFDAARLGAQMEERIRERGIEVRLETEARRVSAASNGALEVRFEGPGGEGAAVGRWVLNCTYSRINQILHESGLPLVPVKHELAEIALIEVPEPLRNLGITVMCGPFFSTMPFPARGLHSLSHVRYTPHCEWHDEAEGPYVDTYARFESLAKRTNFLRMVNDAKRYLPALADSRYVDSLWETKTVLPKSEVDDSRPILFKAHQGLPHLICIMGAKLDNIYDVAEYASLLDG